MSAPAYIPHEDRIREMIREEIASLAGLALRRTQDREFTRSPEHNLALEIANHEAAQFWGEVLAEYGGGRPVLDDEGKVIAVSIPREPDEK